MALDAVFFDFDGVILDSVDVKTKAFAEMYRSHGPDIEKKVVRHHLENAGVSRFDKFRYYHRHLLNRPITDEQVAELAKQFSELVLQKVLKCPFVSGVEETLALLKRNKIPAYVVSGTPDEEIKYIVKERRLVSFFQEVYGSPRSKKVITKEILLRNKHRPQNCLFIGDALSDYHAAKDNDVPFLGIAPLKGKSIFPEDTNVSPIVTLSH